MTLLHKFVDSLTVKLHRASCRELLIPFHSQNQFQKANILIHLQKGNIFVGKEEVPMPENSFYLIPAGKSIFNKLGTGPYHEIGTEGFKDDQEVSRYLRMIRPSEEIENLPEVYHFITFDICLFNAISFFEVLDIPPFQIPEDTELSHLVKYATQEFLQDKLGRNKLLHNYMEEIVIHICRYLDSQPQFKPYIDKLEFLSDRRLVDIVKYIQSNLEKDLSNKVIANVAYVSEDYVGQFFKTLTKKNLQDYIENQRLDKALHYLRTEPDNIQEIAHRVGFKDPAYFSRRFKLRFGYNANSVRNNQISLV